MTTPSRQPPPVPTSPRNGLAGAGMVLGILSLTCFSVFTGIPAIICGAMGLSRAKVEGGRGKAIAALIMGGLSVVLLPFSLALTLPALAGARAKAQEQVCINNVRQAVVAALSYASDHDGRLPASIADLGLGDHLRCPLQKDDAAPSYEIIGGGRTLAELGESSKVVLIRETAAHHRSGRVVGYADGHVDTEKK